jgi:hypothetical protein
LLHVAVEGAEVVEAAVVPPGVGRVPTITTQPQNESVTVGQTAPFSVTAASIALLTNQWQKNSVDIAGASASYTTPATTSGDNGEQFDVVITNSEGTATSNNATLSVIGSTSGTFSSTGRMIDVRAGHTATLFTNGDVLIVGGLGSIAVVASAELYQ